MSEIELREQLAGRRVAVVHDWIFTRRGGEKVLEEILSLFPGSDLHFLFGKPESVLRLQHQHGFVPSFLNGLPGVERYYKHLLPLLPLAAESFALQGYDLVVSSSSCVAKGVIPDPLGRHISYIHSPMRYAWDQEHRYFPNSLKLTRPVELLRRTLLSRLRQWDVTSAQRIDALVANSAFVARRCQLYYGRPAQVVHPPVELERFTGRQGDTPREPRVLLFGAWVPYKRMEHALRQLVSAGIPVTAAGQGTELERCARELAHLTNASPEGHPAVRFVHNPDDNAVQHLYQTHKILLFPALEDFGIIPLEAMASGVLVVAPSVGGTGETVLDGTSGCHFRLNDDGDMIAAVRRALTLPLSAEREHQTRAHVAGFSRQAFRNGISRVILDTLNPSRRQAP